MTRSVHLGSISLMALVVGCVNAIGPSAGPSPPATPPLAEAESLLAAGAVCQPTEPACDEGLARAAATFEREGMAGKAVQARKLLVTRAGNDGARAAPQWYQLGTDYTALALYEEGATALERAVTLDPTAAAGPKALTDAFVMRLGLGDVTRADDDAARFAKLYGATKPDDLAKILYAGAGYAAETHGDWAAAERKLTSSMSAIDRGPIWLRLVAHALLGKAFARRSDPRAASEYAQVRELGKVMPPSTDAEAREYAKGLRAIGEALVFEADRERDHASFPHLAPYAGPATDAAVDAWFAAKVTPWIATRSATIAALEPSYRKVLEMTPVPPPGAVVDASAHVAKLWTDAQDELRALPPPKGNTTLKKHYADVLATTARTLETKAKGAARMCVAYSVKSQFADADSAACGAWLSKVYPRESPPLDELLIAPPLRVGSGSTSSPPLPDPGGG